MNFKLSNIYITKPLNEAHEPNKYAIPEDVINGIVRDDEKEKAEQELDAANQPQQEEIPQDDQNLDNQNMEQPAEELPDEQQDQTQDPNQEMPPEEGSEELPQDDQNPDGQDMEQFDGEGGEFGDGADGSDVTQQNVDNPDVDENGNDPTSVINDIENPDDPDNQEFGDPNADPNADPNNQAFDDQEMDGQSEDMSMDDLNAEAEATPGLHILSTISDNQYKLLNSELHFKFSALITKVKETIEIDVNSLAPNTERLIQCKKIVSDNLNGMIHDLENFLLYTFSDTYESNVITYMKFMKRFQCALTIIDRIKKNKNR